MTERSFRGQYDLLIADIGDGIATAAQIQDRYRAFIELQNDLFANAPSSERIKALKAAGAYLAMQAILTEGVYGERYEALAAEAEAYSNSHDDAAALVCAVNVARIELYKATNAAAESPEKEIAHLEKSLTHLERADRLFGHNNIKGFVDLPFAMPVAGAPQEFGHAKIGKYAMNSIHMPYRAMATTMHELSLRDPLIEERAYLNRRAAHWVRQGLEFMHDNGMRGSPAFVNLQLFELAILGQGAGTDITVNVVLKEMDNLRDTIQSMDIPAYKKLEWTLSTYAAEILLAERVGHPDKGLLRAHGETEMMGLARDWAATIGKMPVELDLNGTFRQALGPAFPGFKLMAQYGVDIAKGAPTVYHLQHLRPKMG